MPQPAPTQFGHQIGRLQLDVSRLKKLLKRLQDENRHLMLRPWFTEDVAADTFLKLDASNDPLTGGLHIDHDATGDVSLEITPPAGHAADILQLNNSGGSKQIYVTPTHLTYWAGGKSYLGSGGNTWIGGAQNIGLWVQFMSEMDGVQTSGADTYTVLLGDHGGGGGYQNFGMYRNLGEAAVLNHLFFIDGQTGAFSAQYKADATSIIRAASGQTSNIFQLSNSGGTSLVFFDANGKLGWTAAGTTINEFSTDGTLAGNSDDAVPTEKAVKTYADTKIPKSILDAKGDLIVASANDTEAKLTVGTEDHQVLTRWDAATNDVAWRDPAIPWTRVFEKRDATAAGSKIWGHVTGAASPGTSVRFKVPTGKKLVILAAGGSWKTGTTAVEENPYKGVVLFHDGTTETELCSNTESSTSTWFHASDAGSLDTPLATASAGDLCYIGWKNDSTSPGAFASDSHGVSVHGILVDE